MRRSDASLLGGGVPAGGEGGERMLECICLLMLAFNV